MGWASGAAVFLVIWWLIFFMILPIGGRATIDREDVEKGQDGGAPRKTHLLLKMAVTTLIAGACFAFFSWAVQSGMLSFRS